MSDVFPIVAYCTGEPCADSSLHGEVSVAVDRRGLTLTAALSTQARPRVPDKAPGTRVHNLWEYDVVECFIAGAASYLEVELGAGGHFLVLGFSAPRVLSHTYEDFHPEIVFTPGPRWLSRILIPWSMVPVALTGVNAFVAVHDRYLCASPLPFSVPDFHQPARFPQGPVTAWEASRPL